MASLSTGMRAFQTMFAPQYHALSTTTHRDPNTTLEPPVCSTHRPAICWRLLD